LEDLTLGLEFNNLETEGGDYIGQALKKLKNLNSLDINVATKNFGYTGYYSIIEGLVTLP